MAPYALKKRLRIYGILAFLVFVLLYFVYHMIQGDHGLRSWWALKAELAEAHAALETVETVHDEWRKRVQSMRDDHVDPDVLEETARRVLQAIPENGILLKTGGEREEV